MYRMDREERKALRARPTTLGAARDLLRAYGRAHGLVRDRARARRTRDPRSRERWTRASVDIRSRLTVDGNARGGVWRLRWQLDLLRVPARASTGKPVQSRRGPATV